MIRNAFKRQDLITGPAHSVYEKKTLVFELKKKKNPSPVVFLNTGNQYLKSYKIRVVRTWIK